MRITEFSLRKPILVVVAVILIIMLGIMGYSNIGSDFFPAVNIPIINISSTYPGASAEDIEREIIKPIEDAVSGISGLDKLNSMATEGIAKVTLSFKLSTDSDEALFDVQKALEKNSDKIPKEATKPSIEKFDQNAGPILILTISGNKSFEELNSEAETIKKQLQGVKGIGSINIFGGSKKELQINVDKTKLDFYNIGITQIVNQIKQNNIDFPGGVLYQKNQDRVINFKGELKNMNQVTDLSIPFNKDSVRLGDLAEVTLDYPKVSEMARVNGTPAIGLIIHKESDANIVKTGKRAKEEIEKIRLVKSGLDLKIAQDSTIFTESSLNETQRNLLEGILTTALILFIFLRRWKSIGIVLIAIPTSVLSTFFMMYILGMRVRWNDKYTAKYGAQAIDTVYLTATKDFLNTTLPDYKMGTFEYVRFSQLYFSLTKVFESFFSCVSDDHVYRDDLMPAM